jgi:hypothetical protein
MWGVFYSVMRHTGNLGMWEWFALMIGMLAVGMYCLRGFGSRGSY